MWSVLQRKHFETLVGLEPGTTGWETSTLAEVYLKLEIGRVVFIHLYFGSGAHQLMDWLYSKSVDRLALIAFVVQNEKQNKAIFGYVLIKNFCKPQKVRYHALLQDKPSLSVNQLAFVSYIVVYRPFQELTKCSCPVQASSNFLYPFFRVKNKSFCIAQISFPCFLLEA